MNERPRAGHLVGKEADIAIVRRAQRLRGEPMLPGDKSISHRALMLASLAEGTSRISGSGDGADVRSTAGIVGALWVRVERAHERDDGRVDYVVESPGADGLRSPLDILDCGNSGTSLRLFAGLLSGLPLTATLDGDDSLRRRPVARIIEPLRSMDAVLHGRDGDSRPPVTVIGHSPLRATDFRPPVPSAQVKSAILLAGLRADGITTVREGVATRDHTERMLRARGVPVVTAPGPDGGVIVSIEGGGRVKVIDEQVPADVSAAAFWLVAGAIHPDAELTLSAVSVNPTRRAVIDLLCRMGADISEAANSTPEGTSSPMPLDDVGEPTADLSVRSSALHGIEIEPAEVATAIDEIPVLCLAAAAAQGTTRIRGAGELRHKESDRIGGIVSGLRAFGVDIEAIGDDLEIRGGAALTGASVDSLGDHRLAMTFAIAGLVASGSTTVLGAPSAAVSYPGFFDQVERVYA